jgi:hypothetical protein
MEPHVQQLPRLETLKSEIFEKLKELIISFDEHTAGAISADLHNDCGQFLKLEKEEEKKMEEKKEEVEDEEEEILGEVEREWRKQKLEEEIKDEIMWMKEILRKKEQQKEAKKLRKRIGGAIERRLSSIKSAGNGENVAPNNGSSRNRNNSRNNQNRNNRRNNRNSRNRNNSRNNRNNNSPLEDQGLTFEERVEILQRILMASGVLGKKEQHRMVAKKLRMATLTTNFAGLFFDKYTFTKALVLTDSYLSPISLRT